MHLFATERAAVIEAASRFLTGREEPADWFKYLTPAQSDAIEMWSTMIFANPGLFRSDH